MRRIYIEDAAAAARGIREHASEAAEEIISWADETASGIICHRAHYEMERCYVPVPFRDSVWNKVPDGIFESDQEWLYALNRHSMLLNLAKAYVLSGKEEYRDAFIRYITSFLDNTSYSEQYLGTSWRSLETGIRPENWLRSIELFESTSPLPPDVVQRMKESLGCHIRQLKDTHGAFHRLSNWGVIQDHGLFAAGAALGDEEAAALALSRLEEELVFQTLEDGEDWEQSPLYHTEVLHCALDTVLVARRLGIAVPPRIEEKAAGLVTAMYGMTLPDSTIIATGDSDVIRTGDLIYLGAELFGLDIQAHKEEENWWDLPGGGLEKRGEERRSVIHFPSGNAFLRHGDLTVHVVSGLMGSGHGHISPMHVDIALGTVQLISDSGRFTYTETPERRMLKDVTAHNVFLIDGGCDEAPSGSWNYTAVHEKMLSRHSAAAEAESIEALYFGYLGSGLIARRKVVTLGSSVAVVIDEILGSGGKKHKYDSFWHPAAAAADMTERTVSKEGKILHFDSTAGRAELENAAYSLVYNSLENGKVLHFSADVPENGTVFTVFSAAGTVSVTPLDVSLIGSGRVLDETEAAAVRIESGDEKWTVLSRSREIDAQVDVIRAGELEGYGRLLVMRCGDRFPTRLM